MATSGNFGPAVATDNDAAVTGWQWEESATGGGTAEAPAGGFANVGTILTDTSDTTLTTLTVNSGTLAMDTTYVRVRADHLDGPSYSNEAILTVT